MDRSIEKQNQEKTRLMNETEISIIQSTQSLEIQNEQSESARLYYNIDSEIQKLEVRKEEMLKNSDERVRLLKEAEEKKKS